MDNLQLENFECSSQYNNEFNPNSSFNSAANNYQLDQNFSNFLLSSQLQDSFNQLNYSDSIFDFDFKYTQSSFPNSESNKITQLSSPLLSSSPMFQSTLQSPPKITSSKSFTIYESTKKSPKSAKSSLKSRISKLNSIMRIEKIEKLAKESKTIENSTNIKSNSRSLSKINEKSKSYISASFSGSNPFYKPPAKLLKSLSTGCIPLNLKQSFNSKKETKPNSIPRINSTENLQLLPTPNPTPIRIFDHSEDYFDSIPSVKKRKSNHSPSSSLESIDFSGDFSNDLNFSKLNQSPESIGKDFLDEIFDFGCGL